GCGPGPAGMNLSAGVSSAILTFSTRTPGSIRCESVKPKTKQMRDAAAINRLFLSKNPRIWVAAAAHVFKIFFLSAAYVDFWAANELGLASRAIKSILFGGHLRPPRQRDRRTSVCAWFRGRNSDVRAKIIRMHPSVRSGFSSQAARLKSKRSGVHGLL